MAFYDLKKDYEACLLGKTNSINQISEIKFGKDNIGELLFVIAMWFEEQIKDALKNGKNVDWFFDDFKMQLTNCFPKFCEKCNRRVSKFSDYLVCSKDEGGCGLLPQNCHCLFVSEQKL